MRTRRYCCARRECARVDLRPSQARPRRASNDSDERAAAGASPALRALADVGTSLGIAAADVVNLLDVDSVVLGGIYAPLAPWLVEPVAREVAARAVTSSWAPVSVRAAALGTTATVVGAAGSVVRAIRDAPAPWLALLGSNPREG